MSNLTLEALMKSKAEVERIVGDHPIYTSLISPPQYTKSIEDQIAPAKGSIPFGIKVFSLDGLEENEILAFTNDSTAVAFMNCVETLTRCGRTQKEAVCSAKKWFKVKTKGNK